MKKLEVNQGLAIGRFYSPVGELRIAASDNGLMRIEFAGSAQSPDLSQSTAGSDTQASTKAQVYIDQTRQWLARYFSHEDTGPLPRLSLQGTGFQKDIWALIQEIPYGQTISYGQLARRAAQKRGTARISAQAAGTAVGKNPIPILIPCHRVIQADGHVGNYTPDVQIKLNLLELEQENSNLTGQRGYDQDLPDPFGKSA